MRSLDVNRFLAASKICVFCADVRLPVYPIAFGLLQAAKSFADPSRIFISKSIFCSKSNSYWKTKTRKQNVFLVDNLVLNTLSVDVVLPISIHTTKFIEWNAQWCWLFRIFVPFPSQCIRDIIFDFLCNVFFVLHSHPPACKKNSMDTMNTIECASFYLYIYTYEQLRLKGQNETPFFPLTSCFKHPL